MEEVKKHTWYYTNDRAGGYLLNSGRNEPIARLLFKEDAQYIVKAVNHHEELVGMLQAAKRIIEIASLTDKSGYCKKAATDINELLSKLETPPTK